MIFTVTFNDGSVKEVDYPTIDSLKSKIEELGLDVASVIPAGAKASEYVPPPPEKDLLDFAIPAGVGAAVGTGARIAGQAAKLGRMANPLALLLGSSAAAGSEEAGDVIRYQGQFDPARLATNTGLGVAGGAAADIAVPAAINAGRSIMTGLGARAGGVPVEALKEWSTRLGRQAIRGSEGQERNLSAKVREIYEKENFDKYFPEAGQVSEGLKKFSKGGESPAPLAISTKDALERLRYTPEAPSGTKPMPDELQAKAGLERIAQSLGRETSTGKIVPTSMSPEDAWNLRKRLGQSTDWTPEVGRTPIETQKMRAAYGALRGNVRDFLESRGEKETIKKMDALASKLSTKENVTKVFKGNDLDALQRNLEKAIATIEKDKSVDRKIKIELLKEIEDQFGLSILDPARNISMGRDLGLAGGQIAQYTRSQTGAGGGITADVVGSAARGDAPGFINSLLMSSPRYLSNIAYALEPGTILPSALRAGSTGSAMVATPRLYGPEERK